MSDEREQAVPASRRRWVPLAIIVLATLIGLASVFALWAKRQVLETETWTETSSELLEDEDIRVAVRDFLVTALFDNVDVEGEIAAALPPQLQPLAGPAASGVQELASRATDQALTRPKVQALWEDANRAAHEKLLALLEDEGQFVATTNGVVTLDLSELLTEVADSVGVGGNLVSKLPASASSIEIMRSDELEAAQEGVDLLETLAWVLTALSLLLYALAIFLARGWRREALRAVGFSFIGIGVLVLLGRNAGGNAVVGALADTASVEPAVDSTWQIATSLIQETGQSLVAYGLVMVIGAWLAGPTSLATSVRGGITPYLRQPRIAYSGLAVVLILLFWWDPVVATSRFLPSLILILALAIGLEALRRQVIREFPDRVTTASAAGIAQRMATSMREMREARTARPPGPDDRLAQLERLESLRAGGLLTEEELEAEKRRILG